MIALFIKSHNMRQNELTIQEFTEELYRLSTRLGKIDEGFKVVVRYMNVIKYAIQGELSLLRFKIVREAYQLALKTEEILTKNTYTSRGKTVVRGRGGKFTSTKGRSIAVKKEENSEVRRDERNARDSTMKYGIGGEKPRGRGTFRGYELLEE